MIQPTRQAVERGHAHMATAIDKVLVDLVGDRNGVVLEAELRDQLEL
jgi:hypothetical protein